MLSSARKSLEIQATRWRNLWEARQDPLSLFFETSKRGPVAELQAGPFSLTVVSDLACTEYILQNPEIFSKNTRGQTVLRALMGTGLVTAEGGVWKKRRRIAQPAFRRPKLAVYAAIMEEEAESLAAHWLEDPGQEIDLGREMMALTLRIAARTLFDDDLHGEAETVDSALCALLEAYLRMMTQPFPNPQRLPVGPAVGYRRAVRTLDRIVGDLIERRRARGSDGDDLLHLWLHSGLDDQAIRDEVVTMLLAAHETTANALTWTFALLAKNPTATRRMLDEAQRVDDLSAAFVGRRGLPFADAVVKESMRLYPPIWMTARRAETHAIVEGHVIRKGALISLFVYGMHHDPAHYTDPEGFDPDRWLRGENGPWMPFGAGQRKCIGSHFALLEARILAVVLARRCRLELTHDNPLTMSANLTLRPAVPVRMRVTAR